MSAAHKIQEETGEIRMTTWWNPTTVPQKFQLAMDGCLPGKPKTITVPPGGTLQLPSVHDKAVQTVINGVVVGGQSPMLVNKSLPEKLPVHAEILLANAANMPKDPDADLERATAPDPKSKK